MESSRRQREEQELMKYERERQRMERERLEREKEELERLKRQHTVKEDSRRSSKRPAEDREPYYEDRKRHGGGSGREEYPSSRSGRDAGQHHNPSLGHHPGGSSSYSGSRYEGGSSSGSGRRAE